MSRYMADLRADDPRHGTENAYNNLKCRCARCKEAHRVKYQELRAQHPERNAVRNARSRAKRRGPENAPIPYDIAAMDDRIQSKNLRIPETLQEWQYAADLAKLVLALDAARWLGLVAGGPTVNVERAHDLIVRAALHGVAPVPSVDLTRRFIEAI